MIIIVLRNAENMVKVCSLSILLLIALELDLVSFQARFAADVLNQGEQIPRTRYGWLKRHYGDVAHQRNSPLTKSTQEFNRSRGLPVDTCVFANANQYARCLCQIEIIDGKAVYLPASDPIWEKTMRMYFFFQNASALRPDACDGPSDRGVAGMA